MAGMIGIVKGQTAEDFDRLDAQRFRTALRNPVEHVLCRLSAGLQSVLGALSRTFARLTGS